MEVSKKADGNRLSAFLDTLFVLRLGVGCVIVGVT